MASGLWVDTIVVPVIKDESSTQSQNALEDLFADVEFQASFPPISATASNNVSTWCELQGTCIHAYFPIEASVHT